MCGLGKRIMIIGNSGAGKSTLSFKLAGILGLPVIHLDREYWNAGWVETPQDIWKERHSELIKGESWIIDGNFTTTLEERTGIADTVILLDFNRLRCLSNAFKRRRDFDGKTRPDMADGCEEQLDLRFAFWILWGYYKKNKKLVKRLMKEPSGKTWLVFKNRKQLDKWVKSLA